MGLSLLGDTLSGGVHKVQESSRAIVDNYHFRHMLFQFAGHVLEDNTLSQHQTESLTKLRSDCAKFLQMRAYCDSSYMQVLLALCDMVKADMPQVSGRAEAARRQAAGQDGDGGHCGCRCLEAAR